MKNFVLLLCASLWLSACAGEDLPGSGCDGLGTLWADFNDDQGNQYHIYHDGKAYLVENGQCSFIEQYFDPDFYSQTYQDTDSGTYIIVDDATLFKPIGDFEETFDQHQNTLDIIRRDIGQEDLLFSNFTLQSPSTPEVSDYISLRNCILDGTCDFIDNRFELAADPDDPDNTVLKFYSVAPSPEMVTAKCSISSGLVFFRQGDHFWYEAKYYLESGRPTTLVDFESSHFQGHPGPRLIFRGDQLSVENKFLDKLEYVQDPQSAVVFPVGQWVTVKVHLVFDSAQGIIQVWQDGQLIIDAIGQNIPLHNWIMNSLEVGISATSEESTIYLDDMRFSDQTF